MDRSDFRLPPLATALDWLLLGGVLAVSLTFYGFRLLGGPETGPMRTVVRVGDERVAALPLSADTTLTVSGELGELRIVQRDGQVWFEDAPCRLHICEKTGRIRRPGEVIVCAPSRVMARVESTGESGAGGLDAISR